MVDLSADVDFVALAEAAMRASEAVEVIGPVEQGGWLMGMGVRERGEMLCQGTGDEERKGEIRRGVERLVERGGGGMGRVYKVLAIMPDGRAGRGVVGFGGDVDV